MGFANARFIGSILCRDGLCRKLSYAYMYIEICCRRASLVVRVEYRARTKHVTSVLDDGDSYYYT